MENNIIQLFRQIEDSLEQQEDNKAWNIKTRTEKIESTNVDEYVCVFYGNDDNGDDGR